MLTELEDHMIASLRECWKGNEERLSKRLLPAALLALDTRYTKIEEIEDRVHA